LEPNTYGYRPKRSAKDAIQRVHKLLGAGYTDVVDADLSKYLDVASYCPLIHEVLSNKLG
jgi:RNA-directed DNA polymerase